MTSKLRMGDFIIVIVIVFLAISSMTTFMQKKTDITKAIIIEDGEILYTIDLNQVKEHYEISIEGQYSQLIAVENGKIRFEKSNCPDKVCVRTGWISKPGQAAVCLPAGVIIKITGENKFEDIDIILK